MNNTSDESAESVSGEPDHWRSRFPSLFDESYVEYARCRTRYTTAPAPDELISRLHLVGVTADGEVVVCRSREGWRFLPGGTREPGESLHDLARRELWEEAGATLLGEPRYFAAHVADSDLDEPYRPHLPHPRTYWAYAIADVRVDGVPSNPTGAETVVEVLTLPPADAAEYLHHHDPVHADVLRHAEALGLVQHGALGKSDG
jgi:8-oxo-dGTP diphosphatase